MQTERVNDLGGTHILRLFTGIHITTSRTCVINDDNLNPGGAAQRPGPTPHRAAATQYFNRRHRQVSIKWRVMLV